MQAGTRTAMHKCTMCQMLVSMASIFAEFLRERMNERTAITPIHNHLCDPGYRSGLAAGLLKWVFVGLGARGSLMLQFYPARYRAFSVKKGAGLLGVLCLTLLNGRA